MFGLAALILAGARPASADVVQWDGIGTPSNGSGAVSVSAIFTNVGSNLQIQLLNRSAATNPLQILTGILFNVNGTAPVGTSLTAANSDAGSAIYTAANTTSPSTELRNSVLPSGDGWVYGAPPAGAYNGNSYQFGLGASGLGGTFSGGLGNEDWGLIGPNSNLSAPNLSSKLPLVMSTDTTSPYSPTSATFIISNFNLSASQITGVTFAFGSLNTVGLTGQVVPEPASVALMGMGMAGAGLFAWRRRAALKAAA